MKRILILICMTVSLFSCSKTNKIIEEPTVTAASTIKTDHKIEDYIQINNNNINSIKEYTSKKNPVYNQNYFTSFTDGNKFQRKIILPYYAGEYEEVFEIKNGELVNLFSDAIKRKHENLLNENYQDFEHLVILKEPLVVGNKWEVKKGLTSQIISLDTEIEVPIGKFETMVVETTYENGYKQTDYYALEVGLVKTIFTTEENGEIESDLSSIQVNVPLKLQAQVFVYDINKDIEKAKVENFYYYETTTFDFKVNDDYTKILEKLLQEDKNGFGQIINNETKIQGIKLDRENDLCSIDLSQDFLIWLGENFGSGPQSYAIRRLVDTVGNFYYCKNVKLTVDGKSFSTSHGQEIKDPIVVNIIKE